MTIEPRQGPGHFQWDKGGWFGGQFGSTLWLLLLGIVLAFQDFTLGAIAITGAVVPNLIGIALWRRRDRLLPYASQQWLVTIIGLSALAVFVAIDLRGQLDLLEPRPSESPRTAYVWLLVFPTIMLVFHFRERAALRADS